MKGLSITNIHKSYGEVQALHSITFDVAEGEIVAVLGPSGCGKSTLLSVISGLETPDQGEITWQGKSLASVPTYKREMGLMFQDLMLFPHRNVYANVAFGLEMSKQDPVKIRTKVSKLLDFVGLGGYDSRQVHTLSGGEQQRVALARSLAPSPRILMLDEPFSSLDRTLRERLILELRKILRQVNQTALYITHDQEEAFGLADRVVVLNHGQVAQIGTPEDIYTHPASEFVARFLGYKNFLEGKLHAGQIKTPLGDFPIPSTDHHLAGKDRGNVTLLLRPDQVSFQAGRTNQILGTVLERSFRGGFSILVIDVKGKIFTFEFQSGQHLPETGETTNLYFNSESAIQILVCE